MIDVFVGGSHENIQSNGACRNVLEGQNCGGLQGELECKAMKTTSLTMFLVQGGLYDMTHFTGHPGGVGRLQMAAGNDLEVYWRVYTQHNRGHIAEHMAR